MNFKTELFRSIQTIIDRRIAAHKTDRTYESIIKEITPKGYIILDDMGNDRTVKCCIPDMKLRKMQRVWVKEPLGNIGKLHICGIV
ncbi:MAG: hypothetical protein K2P65_16155 [Lachnospiraceae bacterium]|nr:hypothetical protein [Lachnospiraceae bacterium]